MCETVATNIGDAQLAPQGLRRWPAHACGLTIEPANLEMNFMKSFLILLAVILGLGFSAQAATPGSVVPFKRTNDLSYLYHGRHYRYYHHHHYYHHRRAFYRHGHRYYRYY
jgi:hypothetical protein